MDIKEVATQLAKIGLPLLGAALPLPGGMTIGKALAGMIGSASSAPGDIVAAITSSSDALQKAREFELTHQETLLKITVEAEITRVKEERLDRDSARQLASNTKAWTPAILSWVVIIATIAMYWWMIVHGNPADLDDVILGRIMGTMDIAFGTVLAFWLGTSFSSRQKDTTISRLTG